MPEGKVGGFGPMNEFPSQNSEGTAVDDGQQERMDITKLRDSSLNAKEQDPYGPCWPGLADYFRGGM